MNTIEVTPTVTAGAYSAGDVIGGELTFSGVPRRGIILGAYVKDKSANGVNTSLVLFKGDITTIADNAAFDLTAADENALIRQLDFTTHQTVGVSNQVSISYLDRQYIAYSLSDTQHDLRGLLFANGTTPSFGATSDITVGLTILAEGSN